MVADETNTMSATDLIEGLRWDRRMQSRRTGLE
jgi:hypothetical protein